MLWNASTFSVALELTGSGSPISAVAFDVKNKNKLWTGDQEGRLSSWIVPGHGPMGPSSEAIAELP